MITAPISEFVNTATPLSAEVEPVWVTRSTLLWNHRRLLAKVTAISLVLSLAIAFAIPKRYKSVTRIMPPDQQSSGAMMLAALTARSGGLGALGSLAGGFLGGHSTTALFMDLLRSGTVSSRLIDRFDLQRVYGKRYRVDTAKHLARLTAITDDKKSGVITLEVLDTDPQRARDIARAYLEELDKLVTTTNNSAAHQERIFIERRLNSVQLDLEKAQLALSEFSSKNSTVDIKEQTRAMVDVGARVQTELLVAQSGLQSLRSIYGDENIRVRETQARIAVLQHQLESIAGSSDPLTSRIASDSNFEGNGEKGELYPQLRQLPRLAVPYADLYRRVKVQETVFELLTQQYEMARIEEAKDVPVVSVIDPAGVAEKKSFPPRLLLTLFLTAFSFAACSLGLLVRDHWSKISPVDSRKILGTEVLSVLRNRSRLLLSSRRGAA
jgi:capsule polysaccharide export protein KpsE/RkpR